MHLKNSISNVFFQAALVRTKSDEVIFKNFYKNYIYLKALPQVDQLEFDWSAIRKATDEERRQIREAVENGKINKMSSRKKMFFSSRRIFGKQFASTTLRFVSVWSFWPSSDFISEHLGRYASTTTRIFYHPVCQLLGVFISSFGRRNRRTRFNSKCSSEPVELCAHKCQ
jgi:hypothetical protein